jgi:hypothetical protein
MARSSFLRRSSALGALLLGSLLAQACASGGGGTGGGGSSGNPDIIMREQFADLTGENARQIVQRLRPTWLRARDQGTFGNAEPAYARVFVDGINFGPIEALGRFNASQIDQFRYIRATDATTRYGTGFPGGIIEITTRSRDSQGDAAPR